MKSDWESVKSEFAIPDDVEVSALSGRWVIQSRANEGAPWVTENDSTPLAFKDGEVIARRLLQIYRNMRTGRESRLSRRFEVGLDEPQEG